jgi:single-stranded-DNA-specific exonuclease
MKDWHPPADITLAPAFREAVGGHPLVAEILARRGFGDAETALAFLKPAFYTPADPTALPDLHTAAEHLKAAIESGKRILVWGDFDVDGQTSTSLFVSALRGLGADVVYHVPHRMTHGHGVHTEVLKGYFGEVDVLLTCDTGVAAHDAIDAARINGLEVLITDHHALPPTLPEAPAVVNPQRLPKGHKLRDLPGVGVSYLLMAHLYRLMGREGEADSLLDLVALGIVCDVATQRHDTRYLLQLGIDQLRSPTRTGLQALMAAADVRPEGLSSDTIGFQIGPRLNALGRLDDATKAVELLTMENMARARAIAEQLELLNQKRKQIENQIYAAAQQQIANDPSLIHEYEALVLSAPAWHPGVIGIVASRLVEQYGKPTVLIQEGKNGRAGGSARSIPGVDIGAAIAAQADMLMGHGGHPGAAGLRLDPDLIPQFRRRLSNTVRDTRDHSVTLGYNVDAVLNLDDLSLELAEEFDRLSPFGAGNPPIHVMIPAVEVANIREFGANGAHRRVTVRQGGGREMDVTWWRGSEYPAPRNYAFDLLAIPRINDWKGRRSLQLEWVDSRPVPDAVIDLGPRYVVVDSRQEAEINDPMPDEALIWVEGGATPAHFPEKRIITRGTQAKARTLVIWSIPPGPLETIQLVEQLGARTIHVYGQHRPDDTPEAFLTRLAGLVKYGLRAYDGHIPLLKLAAATGQRAITVRRGIEWMAAKGLLSVKWLDDDTMQLTVEGRADEDAVEHLQADVEALLAETAAFRSYFSRADMNTFFES